MLSLLILLSQIKARLYPTEHAADKPRTYSALSPIFPPSRSLPTTQMIPRGIRRSGSLCQARSYRLGIFSSPPVVEECVPSTSRQYTTGRPASWSSIRKGKQRADAIPAEPISRSSSTRLSGRESLYPPMAAQVRHFHASRPRYALPLIPATAAILKVSYIPPWPSDSIVYINPHRHHLCLSNPHLLLPYRYPGRNQVRTCLEMA
jgi:hypothetical protein